MARQRKPGLVCKTLSLEIEEVTPRMSKVCDECGEFPERYRLHVTRGSGRHAKNVILCGEHGKKFMERVEQAAKEARIALEMQYLSESPSMRV